MKARTEVEETIQAILSVKDEKRRDCFESLTEREREVLYWCLHGKRSRQIAPFLDISLKTVEAHRANICRKLKIKNLLQLTVSLLF